MTRNASPTARKQRIGRHARTFAQTVRAQGRTFAWLARQTGYSLSQISRIANGHEDGSDRFHLAMERVLGEQYDWPKGLKRPDGAAA